MYVRVICQRKGLSENLYVRISIPWKIRVLGKMFVENRIRKSVPKPTNVELSVIF